ncbi:hypothetical protein MSG28_008099 [Choristoneura fumiferana]|uniref:Uncharacterized protein n=2 Tax=Choristoneura fumiferana TaxID=7141 RepID=A0ACC0JAB5_CHOFU|nr:hypothetical protein MSG28_008099 [Choristoneura fumiferana]
MFGGMMVDMQKGFVPMAAPPTAAITSATTNYAKSRKNNFNSTKLSINERYRRLIPYMTFYYANDLVTPTTKEYNKNIEVEKAQIIESSTIGHSAERQPKKIVYSPFRNIPRYQGNRLTQYNIASANPTKIYKEVTYNQPQKVSNYNPFFAEHPDNQHFGRFVPKHNYKIQNVPHHTITTHKPYLNLYENEDPANVHYYLSERDHVPKYKLVPYEQTPPVKVIPHNDHVYDAPKRPIEVPVMVTKEQVYIKPRPRPQYVYEEVEVQQPTVRKQPSIVSESYYEKRPNSEFSKPSVVGGFKPIFSHIQTTEAPAYTTIPEPSLTHFESQKQHPVQIIETSSAYPEVNDYRQNYYEYVVEQPTYKPEPHLSSNTMTIGDLLNSLQLNKSIPKPITRDNVASSIRTLLQVLNALKAMPQQNEVEVPVLSTPKPFVAAKIVEVPVPVPVKPVLAIAPTPATSAEELHEEQYLAPVNTPSQHLDENHQDGSSSQSFPLRPHSDDEGGTPGRPGVDYPVLTIIPPTAFDCKTQRYKGFFADPETRCQVWHYCDLNGGQASFLCPNGTIFSQAALTCDWWFNVRCASTTQLYVLNESLYKFILPHSPKFPEDYSGPLVDKYLTLKFKEMEEQFKKNKNKQSASEKIDSDENSSSEDSSEKGSAIGEEQTETSEVSGVSEASVVVASPGTSGNVQRLED